MKTRSLLARRSPASTAAALCAILLASACGKSAPAPDLVDAAALFAANESRFLSIRAAFPGPYQKFRRVPARNPADAFKTEDAFLAKLRKELPVEFIDLFPIGDSGEDEIDVVLWRYEAKDRWNTVSLVYFSSPMTFAEGPERVRAFEKCDSEARDWLNALDRGGAAAFCRINDRWHAYQRVE